VAALASAAVIALEAGHSAGLGPAVRQGQATAPAGSAATTIPGGYTQEYSNVRFTMPGAGCVWNGSVTSDWEPSSVTFGGSEPQVSTTSPEYAGAPPGDLNLNCQSVSDNGNTNISFGDSELSISDQVAAVTGSPAAEACDTAVTQHPLAGSGVVTYSQLQPGMQFCVIGGNDGQLVRLTLLSQSTATYDLTWSATAWSIPASNSSG
jgi:hypothetical protein